MERKAITLYPSNWLYNAGVVGFLRVLEKNKVSLQFDNEEGLDEGTVIFDLTKQWKSFSVRYFLTYFKIYADEVISDKNKKEWYSITRAKEKIRKLWGTLFNVYFRGLFNPNTFSIRRGIKIDNLFNGKNYWKNFNDFIDRALSPRSYVSSNIICSFCNRKIYQNEYKPFLTSEHIKILGASLREVPNSFWNGRIKGSNNICNTCTFMILNYPVGVIKLSDYSEIFVNAPSFKLMWYLNKYAKEIYEKQKIKEVKEILGMSIIEMATKLYVQLGKWAMMSIEVVSKYQDRIEFFSLPYEIILLLYDREIASLLNDIGEFKILNMVLNRKFNKIISFGEKILRIALKPKMERKRQENNFINKEINLQKNRENLINFSQKLFRLYALINEKAKGRF